VTDDAERDWPLCAPPNAIAAKSIAASTRTRAPLRRFSNPREASIRRHGWVGDVEHCVKELTSFVREYGITDLVTWRCRRACD